VGHEAGKEEMYMDDKRFDGLVKRLESTRLTRETALRGLAGGALAAVAGLALASSEADAKRKKAKKAKKAKRQQAHKVTICHFTDSEKNTYSILSVSRKSLKGHTKHGDFEVNPDDPNHCCAASDCGEGQTCVSGLCVDEVV
jgi:hypothetical protein